MTLEKSRKHELEFLTCLAALYLLLSTWASKQVPESITNGRSDGSDLGKPVEDTTNGGGVKEADGSQAEGGHGGVVNAPAGLPPCQQVDDGPDGHQDDIPQTKANVPAKVTPPRVTDIESCR